MRHKTKLIIDGVEVMAGAEEGAPAIFAMKLENIACNSPLQMGAATTDCLDVTITNPFKPSFDGSTVELWISPEESSELDALSEITDDVGDESIDEVIDIEDATEDSDDEEGEALTDEEITDVEETEEADTLEQFEILEGEAFADSVDESVAEDAEWHKLGTYHVTQQTAVANGVRLLCYDNISRLAIPFSLEADKTLQSEYNRLVGVVANNGITLEGREMPDRNVGTNYTGTCRDALGYFAGLLGGFASCDENGDIDISSYVVTDAVLIAEELLTYIGASAGEMTVGGFVLKDKNGVELASVGDGQSISVIDPLMIDSDLDELMTMYAGLRFEGATLSARWNESLAAGTLVRVFTRAEYENYLKLLNNETITDDIKAMVNSLGKLVLISSQTIVFGGDTTTVIKSVCNSEADKIIQSMSRPIGEKIEAAAETATNYLNQDETGALVISNDKTDGNMRLDYDSVDIRNGDEVVATFAGNKIELGKNRAGSVIEMCGGLASMYYGDTPLGHSQLTLAHKAKAGTKPVLSVLSVAPSKTLPAEATSEICAGIAGDLVHSSRVRAGINYHSEDGLLVFDTFADISADKLTMNSNPLFKVETTYTASRSWSAKGTALAQFNYKPDEIEGYTPIALVGANSGNTNVTVSAHYNGSVVAGHVYNHNTSAVSTDLRLRFLYVANGLV